MKTHTIPPRPRRIGSGFFNPILFSALAIGALASAPTPAAAQATHFAFVSPSSPAGLYSTTAGSNFFTVQVQALSASNAVVTGFNDNVVAGLYSTATSQISDPQAVYTNAGSNFVGSFPLSWVSGVASFGITFAAGSDSEQIVLQDLSAGPVTVGTSYPGSLGVTTGAAITVRGFMGVPLFPQDPNFNVSGFPNAPADDTPLHYTAGGATDPLLTTGVTYYFDKDYGDIVPQAGGVTGTSGIDLNASCYSYPAYSGGYAAANAGVSVNFYFSASAASKPVTYQVILDYDGSLTDFNNPNPAKDTVLQGTYVTGVGYGNYIAPPVTVAGFQPYQPFMQSSGQVILRLWTGVGDSVTMKYANNTQGPPYSPDVTSYIQVPYSPQNTLPLRSTITAPSYTGTPPSPPYVLAGASPTTLIDTFQNQYSSGLTQIIFQIPADPLGANNWVISSIPAPTGPNPGSSTAILQASGTTSGAVTLDFSASNPVTTNEILPVTIIGQSPATTYSWPLSILSATTDIGSLAPFDSGAVVVNTLGVPDTPKNFTAAPINFAAPGTGGAVSLSWNQSVSQSPQGYIINRTGGAAFTPVTLTAPVSVYYVDSTAVNLTGYNYSIASYNAVTQSGTTSAGPVTAYVNPATITSLSALTGGTTVQLNWSAAVSAPDSYAVAGYQIWRDTQASMATAVSLTTVASSPYNDITVAGGTQYYYQLATIDSKYAGAVTGGPHISSLSSISQPNNVGYPLGNPPNGMAVSLSSSAPPILTLTWTAPTNNLNLIANYVLFKEAASGGFSPYATLGSAAVSLADGLVTVGTSYSYYVVAVDNQGVTSNPSATVVGQAGPQSPVWVSELPSANSITLIWTANLTAQNVVSYNVYSNGGATPIGSSGSSLGYIGPVTYIDSSPVQGTNYIYTLAGVNNTGVTGAMSLPVTSALPPLIPDSYNSTVQQTGVSFNVDLTWTAPNSSANVTAYNIKTSPTNSFGGATFLGGFPLNPQPVTVSFPISAAGTIEYFWIRGLDPGGVGPITMTAVQLPPNPPTGIGESASANAITISWNAISGENVSKYTVYRAPLPSGTPVAVGTATPGTAASFTDSGPLTLGTNYAYYVTATDPGSGTTILGGESLSSVTVTSALAPTVPTGLTAALNAASDNVTLTWNSQLSSELNLQSYTLSRTITAGVTTVLQTAAASVTTYIDTGITSANAGQTILYYLIATNSAGGSSAQEGPVGLQIPPNPPGTPTPSASSSAITVNWTPNVGQNVSQYTVYRESLPGSIFVSIGTTALPPFIDNGSVNGPLTYGGTYSYELTATNPGSGATILGGTSAYSASSAPWGLAPATPAGLAVSLLDNLNDTAFTWTGITDASVTAVYALAATVNNPASAKAVTLANSAVSQYFAAQTGDATYYYWLEAANPYGASAPAGPVVQLNYPAAVNFLPVTLGPSQATVLSWVTLGSDVTSYVESREVSGSNNFTQSQTITAAGLQLPVTLALPFTSGVIYDYEITAINATGVGPNSNLQPFSYLPTAPVSVTAASGTSNTGVTVNLSWSDPVSASQGVTAYTVYKATAPAGPFAAAVSGLTVTTYSDSGVSVVGGNVYYYLIAANDNLGQESATLYSNAVAVTAFALPNPPGLPFSAIAYNGSVTLSWSAAVSTTYSVASYQIQRVGGGVTTILNSPNSPYGDTSVTNGVTYVYTLQTQDSQGNLSSPVGPMNALPLASPGVPGNLSATAGDQEVQIAWNPSTSGTQPIGGYQIFSSTSGAPGSFAPLTLLGPAATGFIAGIPPSPLTNSQTYYYYIIALDNSGVTTGLDVSANSVTVNATPNAGAVNPPSQVAASGGVSQIRLFWTDAFPGLGQPVTSYQVFRAETAPTSTAFTLWASPLAGSSPVTDLTVTNGDTYAYYFVSYAGGVTSSASATVFATPARPPNAPATVVENDGNASVTLNWSTTGVALDNVPVTQYIVYRNAAAAVTVYNAAATVDTAVTNGGTYLYQVQAVNGDGVTSVLSASVTAYPYAPFPVTITSHSAGTTIVTLNFTAAATPSWPVTQFDILRTPALGGAAVTLVAPALTSPVTDTTASTGTLYVYAMNALDNVGHTSALSNAVTDGPSNPPSAPATFVVTAGSQQVLLDWPASAPVSGAIPVSFYILTINAAAPVTVPATQTWYLDSGLTDPAGVTVSIQAVDDSGVTVGNHASTVVGPITVTTSQSDLNPPTGLTATAKTGSSVLLNWSLPNEEGYVVTSFNIYRSGSFTTAVGSPLTTVNNPALAQVTSYTDNSASPGTIYYYVVQAVYSKSGSLVQSPNSNNAVVTTPAAAAGVPPVTVGVMAFNANLLKPLTGQQLGIYFMAPNSGPVELDVYNISGHPIRALYATAIADVAVNLTWDGKDRDGSWAASGIYLIEIKAPGLHQIKKVLVVK